MPFEDKQRSGGDRSHGAPPPMVDLQANLGKPKGARPPDRDVSLHEHYKWRFQQARGDLERLELVCMLAERDYWEHARPSARPPRPAREIREERNRRIVRDYEGIRALEVAVLERCDTMSVRRVRKEFGRDPQDGTKRHAA